MPHRLIDCAPALGHSESLWIFQKIVLTEILFVVAQPNAPCLNIITIPMYTAQNGFPFCKLQGVIGRLFFLINCAPTPPTVKDILEPLSPQRT